MKGMLLYSSRARVTNHAGRMPALAALLLVALLVVAHGLPFSGAPYRLPSSRLAPSFLRKDLLQKPLIPSSSSPLVRRRLARDATSSSLLLATRGGATDAEAGVDVDPLSPKKQEEEKEEEEEEEEVDDGGVAEEVAVAVEEEEEEVVEEEEEVSVPTKGRSKNAAGTASKKAPFVSSFLQRSLEVRSTSSASPSSASSSVVSPPSPPTSAAMNSLLRQLLVTLVVMQLVNRLDLTSPTVIYYSRIGYVLYLLSVHAFSWYVEMIGSPRVSSGSSLVVVPSLLSGLSSSVSSPLLASLLSVSPSPPPLSVSEYDASQARSLRQGTFLPLLFMSYSHFVRGAVQPLIFQTAMGFYALYYHPLFDVYVRNDKSVLRPFGGGGGASSNNITKTNDEKKETTSKEIEADKTEQEEKEEEETEIDEDEEETTVTSDKY